MTSSFSEKLPLAPVLYVEGASEDTIDVVFLKKLLKDVIEVRPLNCSLSINAVSQAMKNIYPHWLFLTDRDHMGETDVEKSWRDFAESGKNLLIWRKRMIESYFIDADYISQSEWFKKDKTVDGLKQRIKEICKDRIFFDIAGMVIVELRQQQKDTWVEIKAPAGFMGYTSKEEALNTILANEEIKERKNRVAEMMDPDNIREIFEKHCEEMLGSSSEPEYGCGKWQDLTDAKSIFPSIVNEFFRVEGANGKVLQGPTAQIGLMKSLADKNYSQPPDFVELISLMEEKIKFL